MDLARAFHLQGNFHLLLLDFRGHGASAGEQVSFGINEARDIGAVLDALLAQPEFKDLPVGCLGISMGGAIALLAAAQDSRIRAVVCEGAYADWGKAIARGIWMSYHIPRFPLGQWVIGATGIRLGRRPEELSPVRAIGKIAPRPVMIIHGLEDRSIPPEEARALFEAAREPRDLWLVPGAEHVACFYLNPEEYLRRVLGFFDHLLC